MAIPDSMRAVQLRAYDGKPESIAVTELPVPRPGPGEVLVRVFASPINPSDLMFIRGLYGLYWERMRKLKVTHLPRR
jgi:NADPH:quinone reductase